jgi:hypothetical protein
MRIKVIVWLGTRTERFDEMREFFLKITGVAPRDEPGLASFDLAGRDRIEVFDTAVGESYMVAPVVGLLVDDVATARAELESRGIEFIGPIPRPVPARPGHTSAPRTGMCTNSPRYPVTPHIRRRSEAPALSSCRSSTDARTRRRLAPPWKRISTSRRGDEYEQGSER